MWLREVVFQGVFGVEKAARVRVEKGFCSLELPPGIDPADFRTLILAVLYPDQVPPERLASLADGDGLRVGLIVEVELRRRTVYKLFRRLEPDSVVVHDITDEASPEVLARGAADCQDLLEQRLFLPDFEGFRLLHLWDDSPEIVAPLAADVTTGDPASDRLLSLYRDTLRLEDLERDLDALRADIGDAERDLERAGAPLDDLESLKAREAELAGLDSITDEEREFIRTYETDDAEEQDKLTALEIELEEADAASVKPLWAEWPLWAAAAASLIFYIVSFASGVRVLALVNILTLGVCASTLIRRFTLLEEVGLDEIRIRQIQRRIDAVKDGGERRRNRLEVLLARARATNLMQLRERLGEVGRVRAELEIAAAGGGDAHMQAHIDQMRARVDALRSRERALLEQQAEIEDHGAPSYELERELEERGVDYRKIEQLHRGEIPEIAPLERFKAARVLAQDRGLFVMGGLIEKTRAAWIKLATHLAGPAWDGVDLTPAGELIAPATGAQSPEERLLARPEESQLLFVALMAAIFATTAPNHPLNQCRLLCLADPYEGVPDKAAGRLTKVLKSIASRADVVVLQSASGRGR